MLCYSSFPLRINTHFVYLIIHCLLKKFITLHWKITLWLCLTSVFPCSSGRSIWTPCIDTPSSSMSVGTTQVQRSTSISSESWYVSYHAPVFNRWQSCVFLHSPLGRSQWGNFQELLFITTPFHFLLRKLMPLNAFLFNKFLSNGQTVLFWWRVPLWVLIEPDGRPIESLNYCLCLIWFCFFRTRLCQIPWVMSITHALIVVFQNDADEK